MIIFVDIDSTICKTNETDYENAEPFSKRIEKINRLYDEGNTIVYWTARGTGSGLDWREVTEDFLLDSYDEMATRQYDLSKMKTSYWKNRIKNI